MYVNSNVRSLSLSDFGHIADIVAHRWDIEHANEEIKSIFFTSMQRIRSLQRSVLQIISENLKIKKREKNNYKQFIYGPKNTYSDYLDGMHIFDATTLDSKLNAF